MASNHAGNTISSGSLATHVPTKMLGVKHMNLSEFSPGQDEIVHGDLQRNFMEAEKAVPHAFLLMNQADQKSGGFDAQNPSPYVLEGNRSNMSARHFENSLFSSSLSDLFSRKMRLSSNNDFYGHSIDTAAPQYEEEEPLESLEEIEAQTIGNLLPDDDDDDLLAGVTDGLDINIQHGSGDDIEDTDLFSNVGGMDLGDDITSTEKKGVEYNVKGFTGFNGLSSAGHIYGELPSRTLFVRNINSNVEDFELQSLFGLYGEIHTLNTTWKNRGIVIITYYDLRSACNAMQELLNKSPEQMKLDVHFSSSKMQDNIGGSDSNQGVVAVHNLESSFSNDELHRIFGIYGEIKEIRETTPPSPHKFIEFYDIRAANAALTALNKWGNVAKQIEVELPHPCGARSMTHNISTGLEHDDFMKFINPPVNSAGRIGSVPLGTIGSLTKGNSIGPHNSIRAPISHFAESSFYHGVSSSVPKSLPSLVRVESCGMQQASTGLTHSPAHINYGYQGLHRLHPNSLPDNHDIFPFNNSGTLASSVPGTGARILNRQLIGLTSGSIPMEMNVTGNGNRMHPGNRYSWNNSPNPHHASMMLPNSPSFGNGFHLQQRIHGLTRAPTLLPNRIMPVTSHHVGSAPTVNQSLWEMQHAFSGESIAGSAFHPGSFGNLRMSNSSSPSMDFVSRNVFPHSGGNFHDSPIASRGMGLRSHHHRCTMFPSRSQMGSMINSFESPNETIRVRRNENLSSQTDNKKQFELDIDLILQGEDSRTTLMIKNIPNKYTSKMLLAAIDERHKGTYDFIYLPIDFKNKCNVGYAFINMTEPKLIVPFYQAFNGKKWEKFNSEKVASIAFARIQGKAALVAHFQNSSLMNEDKRCRPILFNTDGPNAGDQVPFPMGVNIRPRVGKTRTSHLTDDQGSPPSLANGEGFCASDSSSGTARDSD